MEQYFLFVIACMVDLFIRIPGLLQHSALRGSCDASPHFRPTRFLAWILVYALETYHLQGGSVYFLPKDMEKAQSTATSVACATGSTASLATRPSPPSKPTRKASTRRRKMREDTIQLHRSGNSSTLTPSRRSSARSPCARRVWASQRTSLGPPCALARLQWCIENVGWLATFDCCLLPPSFSLVDPFEPVCNFLVPVKQ